MSAPSPDSARPHPSGEDELTLLLSLVPPVVNFLRRMEPPDGRFADIFAGHGLGPRHSRVLMVVAFRRELSVSAVGEALDVSLPAASLLIGELDRAGLLTRVEDARDRRRTLVRVHPDFERAALDWLDQRARPFRETLSRLAGPERDGFVHGWQVLHDELGKFA